MKRAVPLLLISIAVLCSGCLKTNMAAVRVQTYDAVASDLGVVASDLETRALNHATSGYTQSVATLEIMTERAKDLLRQKARDEKTDPQVFEAWISAADSAHDGKLRELGAVKDEYLRLWQQRYVTLQRDRDAVEALKQQELRGSDKIMQLGLYAHISRLIGFEPGTNPLDMGAAARIGTATPGLVAP